TGASRQTHMKNNAASADDGRSARCAEVSRIEFPLPRDGLAAAGIWVRRTFAIYRRAVLNRRHFAQLAEYRLKFIASCLQLRCWLATNGDYGRQNAAFYCMSKNTALAALRVTAPTDPVLIQRK
ncbi:MAG: hypothetical protein WBP37_04235, partial [Candidatus Dechloromonas phosphoritropha]